MAYKYNPDDFGVQIGDTVLFGSKLCDIDDFDAKTVKFHIVDHETHKEDMGWEYGGLLKHVDPAKEKQNNTEKPEPKYKIGDKVTIKNQDDICIISDTDFLDLPYSYALETEDEDLLGWYDEEELELAPAGNLVDVEEATEEFKEKLESGYFDESDKQLSDTMDEYPEGLKDELIPHWEDSSNGWMCSKCKQDSTLDTEYCPHCHAKMANGVKDKKDEFPFSQEEIDNLLKALQNDDLTKKVHDMLSNHQSEIAPNEEATEQGQITRESAIEFLQKDGWLVEHDRILTESNGHCEFTNLPPYEYQSKINPDDVCYKAGYEQGYQEAKTEFYENRYQEGLQDAWELALKLYQYHDNRIIFDHRGFSYILKHYSAAEALEKIKAYEQEQNKIEVGDVIEHETCLGIVTMIDKTEMAHILWEYGGTGIANVKDLRKTGKHYDIQSILDSLGEAE